MPVSTKLYSKGLYEYVERYNENEHIKTTNIVPVKKDQKFGVVLNFSSKISGVSKDDYTVVKVRWKIPDIKDKSGVRYQDVIYLRLPYAYGKHNIFYTLDQDYELVEGKWQLEVRTLEDQLLHTETFVTQKENK
ncbi:DUF3859 domain-containing protein [Aliikangiella maris]|uniref:DUF3859 domain-containing protein n=1 Tax=Aliikangiella maris TaxID=3162458 RepID=A0ABV3MR80_9GAMM